MDLNKVAAAEKLLYDMDMEEKNWRAARLQVGDLLVAVREASKEVGELDATRLRLKGEIRDLEKQLSDGHAANKRSHDTALAEYKQREDQAAGEVRKADERVAYANKVVEDAEKAAAEAQTKLVSADRKLEEVNKKIAAAQELRAQLTKVGA